MSGLKGSSLVQKKIYLCILHDSKARTRTSLPSWSILGCLEMPHPKEINPITFSFRQIFRTKAEISYILSQNITRIVSWSFTNSLLFWNILSWVSIVHMAISKTVPAYSVYFPSSKSQSLIHFSETSMVMSVTGTAHTEDQLLHQSLFHRCDKTAWPRQPLKEII